ncbi:MAG: type II toxin-antitoxin system VapC family toxin [Candidatus Rokubacteria bacterium]|nr:type II toxin-antitoxin system VapC family toxin [Candidatus Rokubacteria bacterium]
MHSVETLNILGYRNEAVANTFFRQKHETRHVAILLPGLGYTAHMPIMYYPGRLLVARGADVLRVEYTYSRRPDLVVEVTDSLIRESARLAEAHRLRAYDAVHLASAAAVHRRLAEPVVFASWDLGLEKVASKVGFESLRSRR